MTRLPVICVFAIGTLMDSGCLVKLNGNMLQGAQKKDFNAEILLAGSCRGKMMRCFMRGRLKMHLLLELLELVVCLLILIIFLLLEVVMLMGLVFLI